MIYVCVLVCVCCDLCCYVCLRGLCLSCYVCALMVLSTCVFVCGGSFIRCCGRCASLLNVIMFDCCRVLFV